MAGEVSRRGNPFDSDLLGERKVFPLHEVYVTRTTFKCGGKGVTGPATGPTANVMGGLLAAGGLAGLLLAPTLVPGVGPTLSVLRFLLRAGLPAAAVAGYVRARWGDPGIVPYRRDDKEIVFTYWEGVEEDAAFVEEKVAGSWIQLPLCTVCQFYRPPGVSHCRVCDNCVVGWKTHSNAIGNCVGAANLHAYSLAVASSFALSFLLALLSASYLFTYAYAPESVASMSWSALLGWLGLSILSALAAFSLFGALTDVGIYISAVWRAQGHRSRIANIVHSLCNPLPPPIDFTTLVDVAAWDSVDETCPGAIMPADVGGIVGAHVDDDEIESDDDESSSQARSSREDPRVDVFEPQPSSSRLGLRP